jgi:hypothetical protein
MLAGDLKYVDYQNVSRPEIGFQEYMTAVNFRGWMPCIQLLLRKAAFEKYVL